MSQLGEPSLHEIVARPISVKPIQPRGRGFCGDLHLYVASHRREGMHLMRINIREHRPCDQERNPSRSKSRRCLALLGSGRHSCG